MRIQGEISMDGHQLWLERFHRHIQRNAKYLSLIGGSLFYAFLCVFGMGGYYYAKLLQAPPSKETSILCLSLLLSFILTRVRLRTFVKDADLVFLLAAEHRLAPYFRNSLLYSFLIQWLSLCIAVLLAVPLYKKIGTTDLFFFWNALFLLSVVKGWNVFIHWLWYHRTEKDGIRYMIRFVLNMAFSYFLLQRASFYLLIVPLLVMLLIWIYSRQTKQSLIHWERLIQQEHEQDFIFYRFLNLFTDIPQVIRKVKPRMLLAALIKKPIEQTKMPFLFVYTLAFIRGNDYLGLYVRFLLITSILLTYIQGFPGKYAAALIFLYLSSLQMLALWKHFYTHAILELYPLTRDSRRQSFFSFLLVLTLFSNTIFSSVIAATIPKPSYILLSFCSGILLTPLLLYRRVKKLQYT